MASPRKRAKATALVAYRIADARHPIFDGTGAALVGGRWNSPGHPVIYAAASYAGAMLERLVHAGTARLPRNQMAIIIHIGARVSREHWRGQDLPPGWADDSGVPSQASGDAWLAKRRSAVLVVPSAVAKYENNIVINPLHPDFRWISAPRPEPVVWDRRLFAADA